MSNARPSLIASRALGVLALTLWAISLAQPALIIDGGTGTPNIWWGVSVLGTGWIGVGAITAGWYANPVFIFAISMLLLERGLPWKTAALAFLLALDTFRLEQLPTAGAASVFSYGPGVAFWLASFSVLLLAVAWRSAELRGRDSISMAVRTPSCLAVLTLVLAAAGFYGFHIYLATQTASVTEAKFLPPGSVKRGRVCRDHVTQPTRVIPLEGPLEIVGKAYPLDNFWVLLRWGVPVVRKGDIDFALSDPGDHNSIYWQPATGPAGALLSLSSEQKNDEEVLKASLQSADGLVTAFEQSWSRNTRRTSLYCPDFRPHDQDVTAQPRSLLTSALHVPEQLRQASASGSSAARHDAPRSRGKPIKAETLNVSAGEDERWEPAASGCAAGVGFVAKDRGAALLGGYGRQQTFAIAERRYFLSDIKPSKATCAQGGVYLYYFGEDLTRKVDILYIQRRELEGFRLAWRLAVEIDTPRGRAFVGERDLEVRSVVDRDGILNAQIVDLSRSIISDVRFRRPNP